MKISGGRRWRFDRTCHTATELWGDEGAEWNRLTLLVDLLVVFWERHGFQNIILRPGIACFVWPKSSWYILILVASFTHPMCLGKPFLLDFVELRSYARPGMTWMKGPWKRGRCGWDSKWSCQDDEGTRELDRFFWPSSRNPIATHGYDEGGF